MIICKSQIKICKKGEKSSLDCKINIVYKNYINIPEVIFLVKNTKGDYVECNVDALKATSSYDYLVNLIGKHEKFCINDDLKYLISFFEASNTLDYLDIRKYGEPFDFEEEIDVENEIYAKITTYELSIKKVLKEVLDLEELPDLYDETFKNGMNKYIAKQLIEQKIDFLKSIELERTVSSSETLTIKKINNRKTFEIVLDSIGKTKIKTKNVGNINTAYVRGVLIRNGKSIKFFEDEEGEHVLIIAKRNRYTVREVIDVFNIDNFIYFKNIVVGVTRYEYVKSIYDFD